jgi:asparagine synthase (glutamine-hydrolysing)
MCGICGKLNYDSAAEVRPDLLQRMMDAVSHRGPDGEGAFVDGPIALGHRRLSIIDLNTGAQPMANEDRTVWIVFNGEIYNFPELRRELLAKGHVFSSATDTEVIIHLYEEYGVDCLSRLRGMFAFALWDKKDRALFLARDRVGIKPLYFAETGTAFLFGSEIKSLLADPSLHREVDVQMVDRFLTFFYPAGRETLFKGIFKLDPGHYLLVRDGRVVRQQYWDLRFQPNESLKDYDEAAEALRELVADTTRDHMISDVPVGVLLSGGVDSTAVLSCAARQTDKKMQTFTIGFEGEAFDDERPFARLAAQRYDADHHEMTISPGEFSDFLPAYVRHMEEPVCEAPAIALYYVSKLARRHVTVLLSGEGGDEAFGGYSNYRNLLLLERAKSLAGPLKAVLPNFIQGVSRINGFGRIQKYADLIKPALPDYYYSRTALPCSYFNRHRSALYQEKMLAATTVERSTGFARALFQNVAGRPWLDQMLYVDTKTWLPDDLLIKADKITMANSLELRVPLLDHVVLEFAASLPPAFKVKGWSTKRIFKKAFAGAIPEPILKRRKAGFPVPLQKWLEHDLRDYAHDILLSARAANRGYFRKSEMEKLLDAGGDGAAPAKEIFSLLTLELWHREFMDRQDSPPKEDAQLSVAGAGSERAGGC